MFSAFLLQLCNAILPSAHADECDQGALTAQVQELFYTRDDEGDYFADVTDPSEWETRLSNTTVLPALGTAAPVRHLLVIGSIPEGTSETADLPLGDVYNFPEVLDIPLRCYDFDDNGYNFAMMKAIQDAGGMKCQAWMKTSSEKMLTGDVGLSGGDTGISGKLTMKLVVPEGRRELMYFAINFHVEGNKIRGMIDSPV